MRLACSLLAVVCGFAHGCSDSEVRPDLDAGSSFGEPPPSITTPTLTGPGIRIGEQASPIPGRHGSRYDGSVPWESGNHSFDTALRIDLLTPPPLGTETRVDQVDYYVFHGDAGHWYTLSTETGYYRPDNVITLYDANRQPLARNDRGSIWPGDAIDARLVVRLPYDGDYYVAVEDEITGPEFFESSFALLYYHLTFREVSAATPGFSSWEGGEPVSSFLTDGDTGYAYTTLLGSAEAPAQSIPFVGRAGHALIAQLLPGGTLGDGSSVSRGHASVRDPSGKLLAEIDRENNEGLIRPPVQEGRHELALTHTGELGSNAFFAANLVLLTDNMREQHEADNGTIAGAEALKWPSTLGGRALLLAELPEGDVDYYAVPARAGSTFGLACEGQTAGSGVRGLAAQLVDEAGAVIVSGADVGYGLQLNTTLEHGATYYLRLSAAGVSDALPWLRCAVVVG